MKGRISELGFVISGLCHLGLLAVLWLSFSLCSLQPVLSYVLPPFLLPSLCPVTDLDDVKEAVPVDTISTDAFNKIMAGEKTSQDLSKQPVTRADKVAQTVEQHPPTPEPKPQETPPPPPPVPTPPSPPPPPPPPPPPAPEPPPRPDPTPPPPLPPVAPPPAPTPPAPTPPPRDPDAEVIKPAPPKRPDPPKPPPPKPVPEPPEAPKRAEVKPPPKPVKPPPPKPTKPQPDEIASLAEETPDPKPEPRPVRKPAPHPKPAPEAPAAERPFDATDISKLLNTEPPSAPLSTGSKVSKTASRGAASGHDTQMSPNLWDALDGLMQDQYKQCWSYLGLTQTKYIPQIKVAYDADGSLASEPTLINKPSDPALRSLAESALRAVKQCNPLKIPAQFAPYYDEWRARVLRFDPAEMAG